MLLIIVSFAFQATATSLPENKSFYDLNRRQVRLQSRPGPYREKKGVFLLSRMEPRFVSYPATYLIILVDCVTSAPKSSGTWYNL